jgi:DNA-binding MurR/RpiR family transcriptional regulator
VSHTGATRETISAVAAARAAGAQVVAVSSFVRSPLVDLVDVGLVAASRETLYRVEAMASRIAHLVVLDALYVALALRRERAATGALEATADALAEHRY